VGIIDCLYGVQVVDTWVKTDLVHNDDACLLDLWLELLHCIRDVRSGDYILLELDSGLDDIGVVDVRDEGDDKIVLLDKRIQG